MFVDWGENTEKMFFDACTKEDVDIDSLDPELAEAIMGDATEPPSQELMKFKKFFREPFDLSTREQFKKSHNYMIDQFSLEIHFQLNKDPKKNQLPMIQVNMVFGGHFEGPEEKIVGSHTECFYLKVQYQQMQAVNKFLEFSQGYTKFQTGVLKEILAKEFTDDSAKEYMDKYLDWKKLSLELKDKEIISQAEAKKEELKVIEEAYSYEKVGKLREVANNGHKIDLRKQRKKSEFEKKLEDFKSSKGDGVKGWFGFGRSEEEQKKDNADIEEMEKELRAEFDEQFEAEEKKHQAEIEEYLSSKGDLDPSELKDMPDDWVKMVIQIKIPETHVLLLRKESTLQHQDALMEILILGISTHVQMGQDFKVIDFAYKKFNIHSIGENSLYPYLLETVFPGQQQRSLDALVFHMEMNPRFEKSQMKVELQTNAYWYVVANMPLIEEVQEFFGGETEEEAVDLKYYKEQVQLAALEYMNQGADYMESLNEEEGEYVHASFDVNINIYAPVVFLPEDLFVSQGKRCLVVNLGHIQMGSMLKKWEKDFDYQLCT